MHAPMVEGGHAKWEDEAVLQLTFTPRGIDHLIIGHLAASCLQNGLADQLLMRNQGMRQGGDRAPRLAKDGGVVIALTHDCAPTEGAVARGVHV